MQKSCHKKQINGTEFLYKYSDMLSSILTLFKKGIINNEEKLKIKEKILEKDKTVISIFERHDNLENLSVDLTKFLKDYNNNNNYNKNDDANNLSIAVIDDLANFTSDAKVAKYYINVISEKKKSKFSRKFSRKNTKNSNDDKLSINNLSTSDDNENIFEKKFKLVKHFQEKSEKVFENFNIFKRHSSINICSFKFYDNDL